MSASKIALAATVILLTGCATVRSSPVYVTDDFREGLILELIDMGCDGEPESICKYPYTTEALKDWVAQNL